MIINAEITAIIDAIHTNNSRIIALEQDERRFFEKNPNETPDELHTRYMKHKAQREAATKERKILELENKILHDNARRAVFDAVMPQAVEILRKYHGKQYGPRTAEKISGELKAACNCGIRLKLGEWLQDIDLTPLDENGYSGTCGFSYNDFCIYKPTDTHGEKRPILNTDNRIDAADLKPDDLRLYDCHEYVTDTHAHALRILSDLEKLDKQYKELERAFTQFNDLLPSKIDRRHIDNFKSYL